ncbi:MAG TPA: hypothetical protein V6D12_08880 [Candidatus Obscuribacterales bacterium]
MAGTFERIEREIVALGEAIASLSAEFHSSYSSYLTSLGQAVRQQVILASYHICTQGYPDSFLRLSFSQRQQLQKALRRIAEQAKEQLLSQVQANLPPATPPETPTFGSLEPAPISATDSDYDVPPLQISNPEQLAEWQENLEKAIAHTLQALSISTNRLLQQAGILPHQVPEAVLEAATKAEAAGESVAGPPNLLNLLMEKENSQNSEGSTVTQIIAVQLRLTEIEFADATVMAGRNQIRQLSSRLHTLRREYQKKQRERTIAEAEAAWRTSWFDD